MNTPLRLIALACLFIASTAFAEDPPPLGRAEARQILGHMDWRNINILAIRQGVDDKGNVAPIHATVVAFATRKARDQSLCQTFIFDRENGWHLLEVGERQARMWNKDGYWEIKAWGTWTRVGSN